MLGTSARTQIPAVMATFTATGTKPPVKLAEAAARFTTMPTSVGNLFPDRGALAGAIVAAIDAGTDPTTDATVQRHVTAMAIANHGTESEVMAIVEDQMRTTVRTLAEQTITSWRKAFDAAAAKLGAAHDLLGDVDLADTDGIVRSGGAAADAWASATNAVATLNAIDTGWCALFALARGPVDRRTRLLRYTTADYETVVSDHQGDVDVTPWGVVCAGLTFSLPTFEEYRQRVQAWNQEAEDRADRARRVAVETDRLPVGDRVRMHAQLLAR